MNARIEKIMERLNPEQRLAAEHREGPMLVAAVAGAGKTATIIARMVALIIGKVVPPNRILAVTFSRKGADEMNERLKKEIGQSDARVGTFHSLALQIVRAEIPEYQEWTIDDRNRFKYAIKDALGYKELNWKTADLTFVENYISWCKTNLVRPWDDRAVELAKDMCAVKPGPHANPSLMVAAYERAEELRIDRQLLTFDDMLFEAVELLRDKEDVRVRWAAKWDYVIQDEAQDQNEGQLLMGELLSQYHGNYMLVGDPSQTVFTWRGAQPDKLLGFEKKFDAKVVLMGRNYRSGQIIIDTANKVLDAMDPATRLPMKMICERGTKGDLRVFEYDNSDEEGQAIATQVQEMIEDGSEYRDFAALYRTNAQSRGIEEALISARIPYRIIGGTNFYERAEVRDLLAYLRLADGRGDMSDVQRCINSPFRFLGKAFVSKVQDAHSPGGNVTEAVRSACGASRVNHRQQESAQEWADMIDRMHLRIVASTKDDASDSAKDQGRPAKILEDIARLTRYAQWLVRDEGQETTENNKVSNIRELIRASRRFTSVKQLLDYIDMTIRESKKRRGGKEPNKVTLTSIHRCIHPDTLVETHRGICRIGDTDSSGMIATAIGAMEYTNPVRFEERDLLTLRTKNGYEITVTTDHGMMAWNGTEYARRLASDLSEGDFLRLKIGATMDPSVETSLPAPPDHDVRANLYGLPTEMSSDLAEFLGLMVADGTVYKSGFRLKKRHEDVRDRFADLADSIFGCETKKSGESPNWTAEINSTFLSSWLLSIGGLGPRSKAIPECIMRSSVKNQSAFLRGIFEDGTASVRSGDPGVLDGVSLHTSYDAIAKTVQTMLLRQGIVSTRFRPSDDQWRVAVYGSNAKLFCESIGFVSSFKNDRLGLDTGLDTRNLVPVSPEWVRANISRGDCLIDRQNAISRGHVSRNVAKKWGLTESLEWHHDRIVSIEASLGPAMCVEVPGHGRFLQNGFDGCNSKGLEWPIVFLAGVNQGVLPHVRAEDYEEERRLFYVGVTRARDVLRISCVRVMATSTRVMTLPPSIFLDEAGLVPEETEPM